MKGIRAVLQDRRRSQHGGVLSGVLFILAFVAIIAGGLMSEVSTHFLLSTNLMTRSLNEATVNSAMELALDQLETSPIGAGCPSSLASLNLNGRTAVSSLKSCWPTYREKVYSPIVTSAAFSVDGSHSVLPAAKPAQDVYMVGDSAGNVYQIPFGGSSPNWVYRVPGSVTGPPVTVLDLFNGQTAEDLMTLVPFMPGSTPPPGCAASVGCVGLLAADTNLGPPDVFCWMTASDKVTTAVSMGANYPTVAFFGDLKGALFAYAASEKTTPCPQKAKASASGQPVIAGPFVFPGPSGVDEVYVVTSSSVVRYEYMEQQGGSPEFTLQNTLSLPGSGAVGVALEKTSLPARLVISFSNGLLATVQLQSSFNMALVGPTPGLPSSIQGAPSWCHCPGGTDQIAVGGTNGIIYLFDAGLNQIASLGTAGAPVLTGLAADAKGEWYYGDTNGYVHEIQRLTGQSTMTEVAKFGPVAGAISSSLQLAPCSNVVCIYLATQGGKAYRVPLDARDVVITSCISSTLPTCSGLNPHLWTMMEVGREGYPSEVHVQGWSYYSA